MSVNECLESGCGKIEIPGGGSALIKDARISKLISPLLANLLGSLKAIADISSNIYKHILSVSSLIVAIFSKNFLEQILMKLVLYL